MKLATAAQMRELDRRAIEEHKISSIDLMERAAAEAAQAALDALPDKPGRCRAAVFCGAGNNGGDGIGAARLLFLMGLKVRAFLVGDYNRLTPDAMEETGRLSECGVELEDFDPEDKAQTAWARGAQVIVDAIFGVGLSRDIAPDSQYAAAVDLINSCGGTVIAVDIASGVEADTGRILGRAVRADRTVTFSLPKIGQFAGDGALCSGSVTVHDIGIPAALARQVLCPVQTVEADFAAAALPPRKRDGHKGDFGKVLVAGGSVGYTGAPYLTASAAVKSGCGLVYLGVPDSVWQVEAAKCVSAMPFPLESLGGGIIRRKALPALLGKMEDCDVLALGPGLGRHEETAKLALELLRETEKPVVLDADGINALEGHIDSLDQRRGRVTILTPHDGEFARIGGDLSRGDRVGAARAFAKEHGCILVLKGHRTVTAGPEGNVLVNTTGNSGLAKGGSGDVLTGLIASLLAQGAFPVMAAAGAAWIHGRAGDLAAAALTEYCVTPEDVIAAFPKVFSELQGTQI
ncbi:NAD(P)H-hydrate dehydratase [Oscillibacter sp.]|uniref:NAD(P)H-hydrate dehydratase n=1 Tax=Oscillibacter sp. TaxID=1945593 RepID=UPI002D801C38|nr:NAD(P)H-hydrate dehydratase [Oscillibacter sp.]